MTEEQQRYVEAWKELDRIKVWFFWGVGLSVLMFALAYGADELGLTSVTIAAQALGLLCFSAPFLRLLYGALTFRCPRCGALGAFHREDEPPECHECKLPMYYVPPRNPDPNWRE